MSDDDERRHESGSEEEETDRENEIILSDEEESSDEEKELEDDAPVHKQLQHIVKSIKAGEVDWTAPREYLGRHGKLSTHLTGQSEKTSECILHFLLRDDDMSLKVERERMAKAIRCIGRYHPQLLTISSSERPTPTPLYLALDNLDSDRIYLIKHGMLKRNSLLNINIKREDLAKGIEKTCGIRLENCLHRAMRSPLQNIDRSLLKRLVECASIDAINAQDKDDWTPLHCAAQYELASEKMLGTIQALIRRGEADREGTSIDAGGTKYALDILCKRRKDKLSVYEVHMKTREEDQELEAKRVPKNIRSGPTPQKPTDSLKGKEENLEPVDRQNRENKELPKAENGPRNRTLLHASRADESSNKTAIEAKEDPKMGIARSNTANTNAKRATASDKPSESERRKQEIREEKREERRREREKWSLAIRNELKLHCLRTRPIAQAKRFLHGSKNDDIQLYFDYSGLPKENVDPGTFEANFRVTRFDEVLQYVEFPPVALNPNKKPAGSYLKALQKMNSSKMRGRKDLLFFFNWLKDKGVKHIIKVIVDDFKDPHSDEVIDQCLSPFTIDILDWSKPDLDPEMLYNACPKVQELILRWGGNNAILRAWSEPEGLRQLKDLRKITLKYDQASERTEQQVRNFANRIGTILPHAPLQAGTASVTITTLDAELAPEDDGASTVLNTRVERAVSIAPVASKIEVIAAPDSQAHGQSMNSGRTASAANSSPASIHKWLESIDGFAAELKVLMGRIKDTHHKGDEIRVALIDDGVDLCERAFREKVMHGKSLGYYWDKDQRERPWYVSDTGHGTVMAHMIIRVCPMAKIYPIKLDIDKNPQTGASQIKPDSAVKAIEAAIEKGVDIISMSWTVDQPKGEMKERFDKALAAAAQKNILMFCSSPDEGHFKFSGDHYPTAHGPDKFFRIGASQADGQPYNWVSTDKVDYIFPGVDVVQANKQDISLNGVADRRETGSSISTALAAGLAALVLWFFKIGVKYASEKMGVPDSHSNHDRSDNLEESDMDLVRTIEGMKYAFKELGGSSGPNEKYIEIWSVLDTRTQRLSELHEESQIPRARQEFYKLARNLVVKN